jgi:hypothetical protein
MAKCIFCKKSHKSNTTSQYKCEITGKYLNFKCDNESPKTKNCKHCKQSLLGRFLDWLFGRYYW